VRCEDEIWAALAQTAPELRRDDPSTWTRPAISIDTPTGPGLSAAAAAPALRQAYDELIGPGRWTKRADVGGTTPVRFPSEEYRGGIGWHIEGNTAVTGRRWRAPLWPEWETPASYVRSRSRRDRPTRRARYGRLSAVRGCMAA